MLNKQFESKLKEAASKLTGFKKRAFMAQVAQDYLQFSPIFDSRETVLSWAYNMTSKGNHPQIHLREETYEKAITVKSSELEFFQQFWQSSESFLVLAFCQAFLQKL